jgi:mannose-6-phosphate isomerase-like protein (cupin superfamily)
MAPKPKYNEIVQAIQKFREDKRIDSLSNLVPMARLYDYGFRSIVGSFESIQQNIWNVWQSFQDERRGYLTQVLDRLDELDALMQLEVPNDYRAITIHFALRHKAILSIKENLEKACSISEQGLNGVHQNFTKAIRSVTEGNGVYVTNWREPKQWNILFIRDVGLRVVKLIYANRHSINLAMIPDRCGTHLHQDTSEVHFSLEPTDGDQVLGRFRVHVTEPHAIPIKPGEWHAYVENRTSRPHQLLFVTGSRNLLGWGIINDRTVTDPSKLSLTKLGPEDLEKVGGILLKEAIADAEYAGSVNTFHRELISAASTGGVTLNVVAIPDSWANQSQDIIHVVARGSGKLLVHDNSVDLREGDVFAVPFDMSYELKNEGHSPIILLGSTFENRI